MGAKPSVERPPVIIGPEGRAFGVSAEATACGMVATLTARAAEIRCPEARLLETDVACCRKELGTLLQLLERASPAGVNKKDL